jgi:hypothetical protein
MPAGLAGAVVCVLAGGGGGVPRAIAGSGTIRRSLGKSSIALARSESGG